jgi:hypothetical protein
MSKSSLKKGDEEMKKIRLSSPMTGLAIVIIAFVVGLVMTFSLGIIGFITGFVFIFPVLFFLVTYFIWAPLNIIGCFPEEGHAIIYVKGQGVFENVFIKYKGKTLDDKYNVVDMEHGKKDSVPLNFGGMYLIPWWPFHKVFLYEQKWTKIGRTGRVENREEVLWQVLLKRYTYYVKVLLAETMNKVPINIGTAVEARIVNPYDSMFAAEDWIYTMNLWLEGLIRDFIRTKSYEDLILMDLSKELTEYIDKTTILGQEGSLKELMKDIYGVELTKISVVDISPEDSDYAKATLKAIIAEREKEAIKITASADSLAEAQKTSGFAMDMLSEVTGKEKKDLQELLTEKPDIFEEKYGKKLLEYMNFADKSMAIRGNSYLEVKMPGGAGGDSSMGGNVMPQLFAMMKYFKMQEDTSSGDSKKENSKKKKDPNELSDEELEAYINYRTRN